jgi:hypothetical protein
MKRALLALILAASATSSGAARSYYPTVFFSQRQSLKAVASHLHEPLKERIEVLEAENCDSSAISKNELRISDQCRYLSGMYRYLFAPKSGSPLHEMILPFSITRSNPTSHALVVEQGIETLAR